MNPQKHSVQTRIAPLHECDSKQIGKEVALGEGQFVKGSSNLVMQLISALQELT
jgi:hypothetical protein